MVKILLVEDDVLNRDMLSRRLKRKGFDICIAVNGAESINKAEAEKPDIILMDMSLPILNGWEATQKIKLNETTKHIPVIALTAHAMAEDKQRALEVGCNDYQSKPVDLKKLIERINKYCK